MSSTKNNFSLAFMQTHLKRWKTLRVKETYFLNNSAMWVSSEIIRNTFIITEFVGFE